MDNGCFVFPSLDGNNIRAEFSSKRGFYKFGSRHAMFDSSDKMFGSAIELIKDKYQDDLARIFKAEKIDKAVAFFEYYSANSSFGYFVDEPHQVTLLDIYDIQQDQLLPPKYFVETFAEVETAPLLYQGKMYSELLQQIRDSELEGMSFEGVVFKCAPDKKQKIPNMFKVKTQAWLNKLKKHCQGDDKLFAKLA